MNMNVKLLGYRFCGSFPSKMPPTVFSMEMRRAERFGEPVIFQARYSKKSAHPLVKGGWTFRWRPTFMGGYK